MGEKKTKKLTCNVSIKGTFYLKGTPKSKIKKEEVKAIGDELFK